jgi:prepilin-type N-terminal cleavage/methylation domain-containing protein
MNTFSSQPPPGRRTGLRSAFTLPELMVTMVLFTFVVGGVISSHIYGLKLFQLSRSKLGASDEARRAVGLLTEEIRTAKSIRIGTGSLAAFTPVGVSSAQTGNSIQIYPSSATNVFIRYFWDATDKRLKRTTNGLSSAYVVANAISNNVVFCAEDHLGNVITNNQNNRVIGLTLQFYQLQYPFVEIGPGGLYDFYQLRTRITRRSLE